MRSLPRARLEFTTTFPLPLSQEHHWYAVYTYANHEKRVVEQLAPRAIEHFLPLYESVRRWKDRRMKLQLPLFPGYVFVRLWLGERRKVLEVPGAVRLSASPAPGGPPDREIEALPPAGRAIARRALSLHHGWTPRASDPRAFGRGEGILIRKKNVLRVVVSLDLLVRSAAVEVDAANIEPFHEPPR